MDSISLNIAEAQRFNAILTASPSLPDLFATKDNTPTCTVTARVFVEYQQQYLYLRKLAERGGKLSLPGGNIEKKEFVRKGLVREIKEEVNLWVKKKQLRPVHTLFHRKKKVNEMVCFFTVDLEDLSTLNLNEPDKFSQLVWVDKTIIPSDLSRPLKFALKQIKKGRFFAEYTRKKKIKSSIQMDEECDKNGHSFATTNI